MLMKLIGSEFSLNLHFTLVWVEQINIYFFRRNNIELGQRSQQMPRKVFDKSDVKKVSVGSDQRINNRHNPQANVYNKNTYPRFMKAEVKAEAPGIYHVFSIHKIQNYNNSDEMQNFCASML